MILGSPGVGKTFFAQELVKKLRAEDINVTIVAKTHNAVQNFGLGAETCDHWVIKHVKKGSTSAHVIVVEEMSQLNAYLWNDLAKVAMKGAQWVLLGDWAQLDAVLDTWCGMAVKDGSLQNSDLMHELAGVQRLTLRTNRRLDSPLFDFYTGLGFGTPKPGT